MDTPITSITTPCEESRVTYLNLADGTTRNVPLDKANIHVETHGDNFEVVATIRGESWHISTHPTHVEALRLAQRLRIRGNTP